MGVNRDVVDVHGPRPSAHPPGRGKLTQPYAYGALRGANRHVRPVLLLLLLLFMFGTAVGIRRGAGSMFSRRLGVIIGKGLD